MIHNLMNSFRGRVRNGKLVVDAPTDLPEGSEVDLVLSDAWDALDEQGRAQLHEQLAASERDWASGNVVSAAELLRRLRSR